VEPFTKPIVSNGVASQQVFLRVGQKERETSMTLGFGELDWESDVGMACREIVSNALDQSEGNWSKVSIETAESIRAKEGTTRVYVEATREVLEYFGQIQDSFLHATDRQAESVLVKTSESRGRFYRQGVFVCESRSDSLLDYNGDETVEIDESRNMDEYRMKTEAARLLTLPENLHHLQFVLRSLTDGSHGRSFEHDFSYCYLNSDTCHSAFVTEFGKDALPTASGVVAEKVRAKGYQAVYLPYGYCQAIMDKVGPDAVKSAESMLSESDKRDDITETEVTANCRSAVREVWEVLELTDMTQGRDFPVLKMFRTTMRDNAKTCGFWDRQTDFVWLSDEHATNRKTILEELLHYVSGFSDETRDFQDLIFTFAARAAL
jgi:hypothetical protein